MINSEPLQHKERQWHVGGVASLCLESVGVSCNQGKSHGWCMELIRSQQLRWWMSMCGSSREWIQWIDKGSQKRQRQCQCRNIHKWLERDRVASIPWFSEECKTWLIVGWGPSFISRLPRERAKFILPASMREGQVYSLGFHKRGPSLFSWLPQERAKFILTAFLKKIWEGP